MLGQKNNQMSPKLSIVIPCYNCIATLKEAVDSVYAQNLSIPFEIIMVDDKSKDNTIDLMLKLAAIHPEIKLYYQTDNKGGGATRNTGIKNSTGDLIFCLDSDNLLYPNTMQTMVKFLETKKCDGVAIHERRYFKENDQAHYSAHFNPLDGGPITFENLFEESSAILDNFLFTRAAYNKTAGYPEEHGFDTQCFEIRFLAAGNIVEVCPTSIFLHRQAIRTKGYFHRVYEEGLFSINFYLIFEEIIYLFSPESIRDIVGYDIFTQNKLGQDNLKAYFATKYTQIGYRIFRDDYRTCLIPGGAEIFSKSLAVIQTPEDAFIKAIFLFRAREYQAAHNLYVDLVNVYPQSKVIIYNIARCEIALAGVVQSHIESEAIKICGYIPTRRKMELNANPMKVFVVNIKNYWKKFRRTLS